MKEMRKMSSHDIFYCHGETAYFRINVNFITAVC